MKKLELDLKNYSTKSLLLNFLLTQIEGMFSPNYDALIDALTFYDEPFEIVLKNIDSFENKPDLLEVFDIIHKENHKICFINNKSLQN